MSEEHLGREVSAQERQSSRDWFDKAFKNVDPAKFNAGARRTIAKSRAKIASFKDMVYDGQGFVPINPEYQARAEATKKLREQYKTYSGSPELASDLLYLMKKEADAEGKNWTKTTNDKIKEMKGNKIAPPQMITGLVAWESPPKKSLAGRFIHWLWKNGFPVGNFIKKELSVEEADKL